MAKEKDGGLGSVKSSRDIFLEAVKAANEGKIPKDIILPGRIGSVRGTSKIYEKCYPCLNQYEPICPFQHGSKSCEDALKCPNQKLP